MEGFIDKILDLWEDYKKYCIIGIIVVALVVLLRVVKLVNNVRGA